MRKQRIRLVSEVGKCIVNRYVLDFKTRTNTRLVYPNLFLVQRIPVCKCLLKIIDTSTEVKYIIDVSSSPNLGSMLIGSR